MHMLCNRVCMVDSVGEPMKLWVEMHGKNGCKLYSSKRQWAHLASEKRGPIEDYVDRAV